MSKRHVKAHPRKFREQVVKLALSCGSRSVRSPRSSRSRWIRCGDGSSWQSPTSVRENAGASGFLPAFCASEAALDGLPRQRPVMALFLTDKHPPAREGLVR